MTLLSWFMSVMAVVEKNSIDGDLTFLFTMDYLLHGCGLRSSAYRYGRLECICSRSTPLFYKKCTFLWVFRVSRHHSTAQIFLCKVRETSTHVKFLLGFWLIYDIVILPPDQNRHSQSTGAKEIFENPRCCWITCC